MSGTSFNGLKSGVYSELPRRWARMIGFKKKSPDKRRGFCTRVGMLNT